MRTLLIIVYIVLALILISLGEFAVIFIHHQGINLPELISNQKTIIIILFYIYSLSAGIGSGKCFENTYLLLANKNARLFEQYFNQRPGEIKKDEQKGHVRKVLSDMHREINLLDEQIRLALTDGEETKYLIYQINIAKNNIMEATKVAADLFLLY